MDKNFSRLSQYTTSRDNNFNLIRFIAASAVLYYHCFPLTIGPVYSEPIGRFIWIGPGDLAVHIFFVSSGFLVTSSLVKRNNIIAYFWARFIRIYPALFVVVGFCVFVIGLSYTSLINKGVFL